MRYGKVKGVNLKYHGNVYISGLTASGKTTHCYLLAGSFGLTYVSGSQIHLSINGMSPIQERKFWITERAKKLLTKNQFKKVDQELQRIEKISEGCIFDSWIMPWRKVSNGLTIYLKSSLESRTMKAAVSRREDGFTIDNLYKEKIKEKDDSAIALYKKLHGVDIENDLSIFDIIIDNTSFIESPTFESSQQSIIKTQSILQSVVGYYLTGNVEYLREVKKHCKQKYIIQNKLI